MQVPRRLGAAAVLACAALGCSGGAATASPLIGGFDVRVVPRHPTAAPPSYFTLPLAAGAMTTEQVIVGNSTAHAKQFHVSAVDGLTGATTGSVYANREDPVRETGRWMAPAVSRVRVPANGHVRVAFTVKVPAGAPSGQFLAGLAIEDAAPRHSGGRGFQVTQVLRTVVGVLVTVPGPAQFVPALGSLGIEELPGPHVASVHVSLANRGRRLGKPTLAVTLRGPAGYRKKLVRRLDTVLGHDSIDYADQWPDSLAKGRYDVTAVLSHDGTAVTRHAIVMVGRPLRGTGAAPVAVATPSKGGGAIPWLPVGLALAAGLGGGLLLRRRPAAPRR